MRIFITILSFLIIHEVGFCQKNQKHPNSFIPIEKFMNFLGNVSEAEETLLKYDFELVKVENKEIKGGTTINLYQYCLNHTLNTATNKYEFDLYRISDDLPYMLYNTSSLKNFTHYKKAVRLELEKQLEEMKAEEIVGKKITAEIIDLSPSKYKLAGTISETRIENGNTIEEITEVEINVELKRKMVGKDPNYQIQIIVGADKSEVVDFN